MAWTAGHFAAMLAMWVAMMTAMMLPSAWPMIAAFATINGRRRERDVPHVSTAIFVAGYLIAWSAFSLAATVLHWALDARGLLGEDMAVRSAALGGVLILLAGLYQWTPFKAACLLRCRSTEGFILSEWRDGRFGAVVMGLRHGQFCIGCCAGLMLLLFAVAMMDWRWVLALAALVAAEKLLPAPALWRHAIGIVLAAGGALVLFGALR